VYPHSEQVFLAAAAVAGLLVLFSCLYCYSILRLFVCSDAGRGGRGGRGGSSAGVAVNSGDFPALGR
jgi:hypothetical protein